MFRDLTLTLRASLAAPRRIIGTLLLLAIATGSAAAQDDSPLNDLPDPIVFARDGEALEALLDDAGYGAAWRSTTQLGDVTRMLTVSYAGNDAAPVTSLVTTVVELDGVIATHNTVVGDLRATAAELAVAVEDERQALIVRNRADAHHRGVVALLGAVAVQLFEGAYDADDSVLGLDSDSQITVHRNIEIAESTLEEMIARREAAEIALADAETALAEATATTVALRTEHERLDEEATVLSRSRTRLDERARETIPGAAEAFVLAGATSEPGLTPRVLDAYIRAEQTLTTAQPGCRITWRTIAAVAAVEGSHGTYGGRTVGIDGRADRPILGLRLDGTGVDNFGSPLASIPDTDRGRWDGDQQFDRAIGPLQFIPESWERWKRDGDGDGATDPFDIDDAAVATGAYLCNYGNHSSWDTWKAAIFGYNHSVDYVNSVKSSFDRIQRVRLPSVDTDPRLRPSAPYGTYVPMPPPEEPEVPGEEDPRTPPAPPGEEPAPTTTAPPDSSAGGEETQS